MTKTVTVFTLASVVILTGCPKKGDSADAAAEGGAIAADTSTATADTSTAAATAPTAGGAAKTPTKIATDAGAGEAGADGGTMADGGAVDQCCCDVGGKKEMAGQSACTKDKKGACVKRELCAALDAGAATTTPDAGAAVQQCCCDVGGKKELAGQSACVKEKKGACVKMDQCKPK